MNRLCSDHPLCHRRRLGLSPPTRMDKGLHILHYKIRRDTSFLLMQRGTQLSVARTHLSHATAEADALSRFFSQIALGRLRMRRLSMRRLSLSRPSRARELQVPVCSWALLMRSATWLVASTPSLDLFEPHSEMHSARMSKRGAPDFWST